MKYNTCKQNIIIGFMALFFMAITVSCDDISNFFDGLFKNKQVEITTGSSEASVNEAITLNATTDGKYPDNICCIWDFGDGTPKDTVCDSKSVNHNFTKPGEYEVFVEIIDGENGELISNTSIIVTILSSDLLSKVQQYLYVEFYIYADISSDHERISWSYVSFDTREYLGDWQLVWDGPRFSVHIDTISSTAGESEVELILEGEMNVTADTLKALYARSENYYPDKDLLFWRELSIFNLPLPDYYTNDWDPHYYADSSGVQQYIDSYSIGDYTVDENDDFERVYSTTINYGNTSGLMVRFIK
ncbi:MAG: PKD domain-containing protein [Prolixibacteraceae bacterium]|nr:PKD domain-containing protein [Prolixibacteraceae bacterium]